MTTEINKTKLLESLYRWGYFWAPSNPDGWNVQQADLPNLDVSHPTVKEALRSWQLADMNFDAMSLLIHLRSIIDGEDATGPVTQVMLEVPRCPLPDFPPPAGVRFRYDEPDLQSAVERMQAAATGNGSWPTGCHGTSGVHEVTVSYDASRLSTKQTEWLPAVKRHNAAAVGAMGLKVVEVPVGQNANVEFYGKSYGGGIIGMAQFNSQSCRDSVFCTVSPGYAPNYRMFLILAMHEFGHTMNFEHSNRYIMNPSIMDVPEYWIQRDESGRITYQDVRYAKGKQFFGGEPVDPGTPNPTPTPDYNGVFTFGGQLLKIKVYE